ncbi:Zinc finger, RING/FYVE/PHD-type [Ascosphaera apis ARSEF 7405]|uniref:Zinc finger, RING/FYVE/PHD-type n=1 Tax=Ascosphaera apis ARSEF 7405 TaxID=392613 RepID=A0A168AZX2_9EURO|nr:Zinc finger, RING/FYVE/PHD-type [Ascosphaera apis ARSEF 7405]
MESEGSRRMDEGLNLFLAPSLPGPSSWQSHSRRRRYENIEESDQGEDGNDDVIFTRQTTNGGRPEEILRRPKRRRQNSGILSSGQEPVSLPESAPSTRSHSFSSDIALFNDEELFVPETPGPFRQDPALVEPDIQAQRSPPPPPPPSQPQPPNATSTDRDPIDLTDVEDETELGNVLSRQREDAVLSQVEHPPTRSILTAYKCPICMDDVIDATTTACGHLFCHKCILDTLRFSEDRRPDSRANNPRGTCPACRKPLNGNDLPGRSRNLVPLQLKLATRRA